MPTKMSLARLMIDHEFHSYQEWIESTGHQIDERQKKLAVALNEQITEDVSVDSHDDFWSHYEDELTDIDHSKNIVLGALLVASWDSFVCRLFKICQSTQRRSCHRGKPINNQNYNMSRAEKDLKGCGISVPTKCDLWCEAENLGQIRNRLVHTGGILEPSTKNKLLKHAKAHGLIVVPEDPENLQSNQKSQTEPFQLLLTTKYCKNANETLRQLLIELLQTCEDHLSSTAKES